MSAPSVSVTEITPATVKVVPEMVTVEPAESEFCLAYALLTRASVCSEELLDWTSVNHWLTTDAPEAMLGPLSSPRPGSVGSMPSTLKVEMPKPLLEEPGLAGGVGGGGGVAVAVLPAPCPKPPNPP